MRASCFWTASGGVTDRSLRLKTKDSFIIVIESAIEESLTKLIQLLQTPSIPEIGLLLDKEQQIYWGGCTLLHFDEAESAQTRLSRYFLRPYAYYWEHSPMLSVFTSTASRLYELAPPQMIHSSARVIANDTILPYWELPFDINPRRTALEP